MSAHILNKNGSEKRILLLQKELALLQEQLNERVLQSHKIIRNMQKLADQKKVDSIKSKLAHNSTI